MFNYNYKDKVRDLYPYSYVHYEIHYENNKRVKRYMVINLVPIEYLGAICIDEDSAWKSAWEEIQERMNAALGR